MTCLDIAQLRLANQQITAHAGTTPLQVVDSFGAIQAQDYRGAHEYVLGYADRGVALDAGTFQRVVPGGNGVFRPTIMVEGRVVGTWRLGTKKEASSVVDLFSPLDGRLSKGLTSALREYDDFISGPAKEM